MIVELEKIEDKDQEIGIYCEVDEIVIEIANVETKQNEDSVDTLCIVEKF